MALYVLAKTKSSYWLSDYSNIKFCVKLGRNSSEILEILEEEAATVFE